MTKAIGSEDSGNPKTNSAEALFLPYDNSSSPIPSSRSPVANLPRTSSYTNSQEAPTTQQNSTGSATIKSNDKPTTMAKEAISEKGKKENKDGGDTIKKTRSQSNAAKGSTAATASQPPTKATTTRSSSQPTSSSPSKWKQISKSGEQDISASISNSQPTPKTTRPASDPQEPQGKQLTQQDVYDNIRRSRPTSPLRFWKTQVSATRIEVNNGSSRVVDSIKGFRQQLANGPLPPVGSQVAKPTTPSLSPNKSQSFNDVEVPRQTNSLGLTRSWSTTTPTAKTNTNPIAPASVADPGVALPTKATSNGSTASATTNNSSTTPLALGPKVDAPTNPSPVSNSLAPKAVSGDQDPSQSGHEGPEEAPYGSKPTGERAPVAPPNETHPPDMSRSDVDKQVMEARTVAKTVNAGGEPTIPSSVISKSNAQHQPSSSYPLYIPDGDSPSTLGKRPRTDEVTKESVSQGSGVEAGQSNKRDMKQNGEVNVSGSVKEGNGKVMKVVEQPEFDPTAPVGRAFLPLPRTAGTISQTRS